MNETKNGDESPSVTVMKGYDSEGRKIQCSPISTRPSGDNDGDARNANYETPKAAGVKELVSVTWSQFPLPVLEK